MIKNLVDISPKVIIDCLTKSFADYTIPMPSSQLYWENRWDAAGIDYNLSYGFFSNNTLVGFVLHAVGTIDNKRSFFNLCTGVIPEFRGQRIVKKIYDTCYHDLLKSGFEQGFLEVLQSNSKAIRAYQSVGFNLNLELISYNNAGLNPIDNLHLKPVPFHSIDKYAKFKNHHLAWEHRDNIILKNPSLFDFYELHQLDQIIGYAIIKKDSKNILQFGVLDGEWDKHGSDLFGLLHKIDPNLKIINIDTRDKALISFFNKNNFKVLIKQFEMLLEV